MKKLILIIPTIALLIAGCSKETICYNTRTETTVRYYSEDTLIYEKQYDPQFGKVCVKEMWELKDFEYINNFKINSFYTCPRLFRGKLYNNFSKDSIQKCLIW